MTWARWRRASGMASAPSSDQQRRESGTAGPAVAFPPRSGLPGGITVEKIPWLGTTWYERGLAYWALRLALTLFAVVFLALFTAILVVFLQGVYRSSQRHAWFYGLLAFEIVFSLATGGYLTYRMIKHPVTATTDDLAAARPRVRGAAGVGILARSGSVLAQLFIVLVAALSYGLWAAATMRSLSPVLPTERQARQRLAERLRARGYDVAVSQPAGRHPHPTEGMRMGLFDHTAKRLAKGPTLVLAADPADALADLLQRYDPALRARGDHLVFGNGVLLYGPIEITPELAAKAGLPGGLATAYHASILPQAKRPGRPEDATRQDAERLIRGLAARPGGSVHGERPPMAIHLRASVYSPAASTDRAGNQRCSPTPTANSSSRMTRTVPDAYFLITEESPSFFTTYWPPRLSRSTLKPPAPAIGAPRDREPCRWELATKHLAATADREICLTVGRAAFDLARRAGGVVIDTYGFPLDQPEDLLPR